MRDDFWTCRLTPIQQKMLLVQLEGLKDPNKLDELKQKVKGGVL